MSHLKPYKIQIKKSEKANRVQTVSVWPNFHKKKGNPNWMIDKTDGGFMYFASKKQVENHYEKKGYTVKEL